MHRINALLVTAAVLLAGAPLAGLGCGPTAAPAVPRAARAAPPDGAGADAPAATSEPTATATASAAPSATPQPAAPRIAVASENATATRIALDVLRKGGSAADAAIAGVLAIGVVQPVSSGIGGGGFAMVWDAKKKAVTVLDFRETAPAGIKLDEYVRRPPPDKKRGVMVGVPGEVAGLFELHGRFGKLAFADDARGAADAAERGFAVSPHLARALGWNRKWALGDKRFELFRPTGNLAVAGETVKSVALAASLRRIAAEGKAAFYEGEIARDVLATARDAGSRMTPQDLAQYRVIERTALKTRWEGLDVLTMPPPSAGGLLVLETLHMHDKASLEKLGYQSGAYLHLLAETFRGAIADRVRAVGDPDFVKVDVAKLTDPARMKARRAKIALDTTTPPDKFTLSEAGTSHLVAVDAEGNVVSITTTVNNMFGAKLVTKGGFFLNDELDDFTPVETEKRFGVNRGPNSPRGGARPVSSMTPTLVLEGDTPVLALGGSGGMRIPTGVAQVLLATLVFGRAPAQAVADLRLETPAMGGLFLDASAKADLVADLEKRGEVVDTTKPNFSAVQAVDMGRAGAPRLRAGADPRKGGDGVVE